MGATVWIGDDDLPLYGAYPVEVIELGIHGLSKYRNSLFAVGWISKFLGRVVRWLTCKVVGALSLSLKRACPYTEPSQILPSLLFL